MYPNPIHPMFLAADGFGQIPGYQSFSVFNNVSTVPYPYLSRNNQQWVGIDSNTPSQFIFSAWLNPQTFAGIPTAVDMISTQTAGRSSQFRFMLLRVDDNSAVIQIRIFSSSFATYIITFPDLLFTNTWTHIAVSAYLPSVEPARVVATAINGTLVTPSLSVNPSFTTMGFNWATNSIFTFADVQGNPAFMYKGTWAEFYFAPGQYLNFLDSTNLRKFISPSGGTKYLGENGELPTGTSPALYLRGPKSNLYTGGANAINWGTGGIFTISGTDYFSDGATNPPSTG